MSFWRRLFGKKEPPAEAPAAPATAPVLPPYEEKARAVEVQLDAVREVSQLPQEALREAVDGLLAAGREVRAMSLLRKVLLRFSTHGPSLLRLGEIGVERRDLEVARPALTACAEHGSRAERARANFLLAELAEAEGAQDEAAARYEAVLALDYQYPLARERARRLREELGGTSTQGAAAATQTTLGEGKLGRFSLLRELGRGGAGAVYLAQDAAVGRQVALKILHAHLAAKDQERSRFFAEARAAARIRHPGVIVVYDLDESLCALAMEHLPGGTLKEQLAHGLSPRSALAICRELAEVLAVIHRLGFVHRDLKPANLLFRAAGQDGSSGRVVLSDFGVAHLGGEEAGQVVGTLAYMAPEQRRGAPATPQVDLYALGAILYECLAGAPPLRPEEIARGVTEIDLGPALVRLPAPRRVGRLLAALLAEDPARRPPDAAAVAQELQRCQAQAEMGEDGPLAFTDALSVSSSQPLGEGAARALARAAKSLGLSDAQVEAATTHLGAAERALLLGALQDEG